MCNSLPVYNNLKLKMINICNDDVFEGDVIICSRCDGFMHFACATLRETSFRKMSKTAKQNWCCNRCKFHESSNNIPNPKSVIVLKSNESHTLSN